MALCTRASLTQSSPASIALSFCHPCSGPLQLVSLPSSLSPVCPAALCLSVSSPLTPLLVALRPCDSVSFPPSFPLPCPAPLQVCHKYSGMEISAICQLLANQLRAGDSFDLLVLKELVESMTGITIIQEVSDKQVCGILMRVGGGGAARHAMYGAA